MGSVGTRGIAITTTHQLYELVNRGHSDTVHSVHLLILTARRCHLYTHQSGSHSSVKCFTQYLYSIATDLSNVCGSK